METPTAPRDNKRRRGAPEPGLRTFAGTVVLTLGLSLPATAADPAEEQVPELRSPAQAESEPQGEPSLSTQGMEDHRRAIERLESEQGPWSSGLAEQLRGLGQSFQTRGRHREAIEIFQRAVHINRVNNGLYDLGQVPIIESMLDSLMARGRWEDVHARHQHLYWLYKRNYGADDPRMLPIIARLGKWYINDYALNPERRMTEQLVDAHELFEQAISIITGSYGQQDLRLVEPLRGLVASNWYFHNHAGDGYASSPEREQLRQEIHTDQVTYPDRQPPSNQVSQYLRNNYADGKRAIERIRDIYAESPDAPEGAAAQATVELADWQQMFNRERSARDLYSEAWETLQANESTRPLAEKLFSRPVPLPDMELVESDVESSRQPEPESDEPGEPVPYLLVNFNVNRFGRAEDVEVVESWPDEFAEERARAKQMLEATRFRPRVVDGEAVDTEDLSRKFLIDRG